MDDGLYLASCLAVLALCIISYWKIRETYVAARTPLGMYPTKHSIPWPHLTGQCQHIQDLSQSWNPSALTRFINLINPDLPYSAIQADWFHPIDAMPPIFSRRNSHCTVMGCKYLFRRGNGRKKGSRPTRCLRWSNARFEANSSCWQIRFQICVIRLCCQFLADHSWVLLKCSLHCCYLNMVFHIQQHRLTGSWNRKLPPATPLAALTDVATRAG